MNSSSPITIPSALLVFLLSEEVPTILLTASLQMCFNYVALLEYSSSFGATNADIVSLDYNARKIECVWQIVEKDVSGLISSLSSFIAFW